MIRWSNEDKLILFQSLYAWLCEERTFMFNVKNSSSLTMSEKEVMLSNSRDKIKNIENVIDKINEL